MALKALLALLLPLLFLNTSASDASIQSTGFESFSCSSHINTCSSLLYSHNDLQVEQISTYYSVEAFDIIPISHGNKSDFLVAVPCSCKQVNGTNGVTVGYFYDVQYEVQPNDTFANVSAGIYSGQAWPVGGDERFYKAGSIVPVHLLCGCVESDSEIMVTYTVQENDTLVDITNLLSADINETVRLNKLPSPDFIDVGWVLFVPMETN